MDPLNLINISSVLIHFSRTSSGIALLEFSRSFVVLMLYFFSNSISSSLAAEG